MAATDKSLEEIQASIERAIETMWKQGHDPNMPVAVRRNSLAMRRRYLDIVKQFPFLRKKEPGREKSGENAPS